MSKSLKFAVALTCALACTVPSAGCETKVDDSQDKDKITQLETENARLKKDIDELRQDCRCFLTPKMLGSILAGKNAECRERLNLFWEVYADKGPEEK